MTSSPISQISAAIEQLRQLTQVNMQSSWRCCTGDLPVEAVTPANFLYWRLSEINPKGQIVWLGGYEVLWLAQQLIIPQDLQRYPLEGLCLRLALTWWAEDVQIFVNGTLVQRGDLLDYFTRVLLSPAVTPGEAITVALRLVSPSHCEGALMRSLLIYEYTESDRLEPGFIADELAVLQRYLEAFNPDNLNILAAAISEIDWEVLPDRERFERSLQSLRQTLLADPPQPPLQRGESISFNPSSNSTRNDRENSENPLQSKIQNPKSKISLLGHAHLDMAWLWPVSETWDAAQRTFESVLQLQQDFPDLIFCHSTPALYAWIEKNRPDLFTTIQKQVKSGHWEIVGGMWIEPDLNLIDGESIVRQILYGQRYVWEKFGQFSTVAWVPDTFGFCATLPQFLKQGGIEYFVTQKLAWNDTTKFPYGVFWWQSPDGTQILSLMSALIGEGIDPIKMASYAVDWEIKTKLQNALWLPGVGDHGGGPTRDMLEIAQRWQNSLFFPQLEFTTARSYLQQIQAEQSEKITDYPFPITHYPFPIWNDELYLEFHRGCYTTHADQKRWNRRCEGLLYQAELFASLATLSANAAYPKAELEAAWKKVLFNQFHDILPGTSITQVFVEANQAWQEVEQVGSEILAQSLSAIASQISLPSPPQPDALPILVFNPLNWQRTEVVTIPLPVSPPSQGETEDLSTTPPLQGGAGGDLHWQIYDLEGQPLISQLKTEVLTTNLLFTAADIPSVGYRLFWLCPQKTAQLTQSFSDKNTFSDKDWALENEFLQIIVNPETGNLSSIYDKINQREILQSTEGNQLQAFKDSGQYWDAWNIDPNYSQHPLPPTNLKSINWIEQGPVQQRLQVIRQWGESEFYQDYILPANSSVLKITTTVNWQERHVLVKAAFPFNLEADYATYEIACGAIQRPTQPQAPAEKAKWEVPALRWADLTQIGNGSSVIGNSQQSNPLPITNSPLPIYGVSLLNDCKYGYDSQPDQLRLTLLRSPSWPDPEADRGYHEFTYAIYPHSGSWQSAHTVRRGYELNLPLQVMVLLRINANTTSSLPPVGRFLDLSAENLILMALKQSEDDPQQWILRCYECHGEEAELKLHSDVGLAIAQPVDLLERSLTIPQPDKISPWQILSFQCTAKKNPPPISGIE